ncbi:MAG TPA: Gfo/Idh/MocA family oxidoreductase [Candidatus Limnocylindria bacterium]|jgi:predicted dehydrogenase|nr:Gfo/Idh/MocA family oxidoreductase [Candidatus Limnocylindria bacterium]
MNNTKPCRWGILGTANIARKNWQAIRDAANAQLVAVASRESKKATRFIAECQEQVPFSTIPDALGNYESLLSRPDIDAIYLPLPTGLRKEWAIRAANAGKHILVEKPVGCTVADAEEIVAACDRNRVQFMDGVMFAHSRRLQRMRQTLDDNYSIGDIRRITSHFSFLGDDDFFRTNMRADSALEPLGCLGDLGWYCIRFSLWAMGEQLPVQVTGRIHAEMSGTSTGPGVPTEFSGELFFEGGVSASFYCSFRAELAQYAIVNGTRGYLHVPDFVLPYSGAQTRFSVVQSDSPTHGCRFDMNENRTETQVEEPSNNAPGSQESNLFRDFSALVLAGKIDHSWAEMALKTQRVANACLESARTDSTPVRIANHWH